MVTAFAGCKRNEEESYNNTSSNKKVQRDSRLVGKWNASTEIVIGEKGETVTSKCTVTFKKDGSFSQITSEKQARQMIVDTYLISFGCKNEKELEEYIRKNTKLTLEAYIAMAMADMTENDFNITGTWKTENNNTLYETTFNGTRNVTEITKYTVSNDGNTVKINIKNGDATVTMVLTKA